MKSSSTFAVLAAAFWLTSASIAAAGTVYVPLGSAGAVYNVERTYELEPAV